MPSSSACVSHRDKGADRSCAVQVCGETQLIPRPTKPRLWLKPAVSRKPRSCVLSDRCWLRVCLNLPCRIRMRSNILLLPMQARRP